MARYSRDQTLKIGTWHKNRTIMQSKSVDLRVKAHQISISVSGFRIAPYDVGPIMPLLLLLYRQIENKI